MLRSLARRLRKSRPTRRETDRLLDLARPHAALLALGALLLVLSSGLSLAVPWLLARMVDGVLARPAGDGAVLGRGVAPGRDLLGLGELDPAGRLNLLAVLLLLLLLARAFLGMGQTLVMARAGEGIVVDLRTRLFAHLTGLGPTFFDERRVGELVSRLMNDVVQVQSVLTAGLAEFLGSGVTLVGALAIMLWTSWRLAAAIILVVPPVVLLARGYARQMHERSKVVQDRMADASAVAEETLGAIRLVQVFVREPYEQGRFGAAADGVYRAAVRRAQVQAFFGPSVGLLTMGALVVVLWTGGRLVLTGALAAGDLVAFLAYAGMTAASASGVVGVYGRWSGALGASRRVFDLLDTRPSVSERPGAGELRVRDGAIAFTGVGFAYARGDTVLEGIDLRIEPGTTVALVGPTGAGKSTFMHLIARFYDPVEGVVSIDGTDLRTVTIESVRRWIGVVPQETVLFNSTVAENLRYGRLDATVPEIEAAARAAYVHDFLAGLPDGYDTLVGERGIRLSAGQRQRMAIARAMLKDPRILLLDEATSSLDSESEQYVQAALERLFEGRTTVVVAHRLSTVFRADRIVVMDRGRIVETGTHAGLIRRGGLYARLCAIQFGTGAGNGPEETDILRPQSTSL